MDSGIDNTWIKSWRRSQYSQVFQDAFLWKVWCWCLFSASYKERWVSVQTGRGFHDVKLNPGQFVFGRFEAAQKLNMKPSSVRNRMEKLKKMGNIAMQVDTHFSIITIINWDTYQGNGNIVGQATGQASDTQVTGNGHPMDTNNKEKKGKECKEGEECKEDKTDILSPSEKEGDCGPLPKKGEKIPYKGIVDYLNDKSGKDFKYSTKETQNHIRARWNQGFRLEDFLKVIDKKCEQWLKDAKMNEYLRPQTLFGTKFESYLNQNPLDWRDE